ncbi:pirin family protein [Flagellimonas allohymeniacidonis]|uniref:Pirin family protein n=1 Tax=Flagellimonas allohymeniacidonis TaxID=2517819 RepID=A0A4Q8QJG0_9FLAO|nr:pirin family protein [Allomuricauda hymeniacidonis]TAI48619.1 pirin family protein [Allomuricauda hymeniacidonis]
MSTGIKHTFPLGFPWQTEDPFLFCVYHLDHYPKGEETMGPDPKLLEGRNIGNDFTIKDGWRMYHGNTIPGFPYHPHRGFETITIVNKGFCDHSDSLGAAGRFGEGDVQWMTAGRGVQHSEMFPLLKQSEENPLELFQIWLNLPKVDKLVEPHFKMLWHEDIPVVQESNAAIKVIAGVYKGSEANSPAPNSWAAKAENEVAIWNIKVDEKSEYVLPKAKTNVNRTLYFYEGSEIYFGDRKVNPNFGISLDGSEDVTITIGKEKAHFLLLQGNPIDERVAKYGPFVMNTNAEIEQAMEEYRLTQFGGWPWPYPDNVHDREKGRFALYPDGTIIEK